MKWVHIFNLNGEIHKVYRHALSSNKARYLTTKALAKRLGWTHRKVMAFFQEDKLNNELRELK